jgi:hypothetical protein
LESLLFRPSAAYPPQDLGGFRSQFGGHSRLEMEVRSAENLQTLRQLVPQELASMFKCIKCLRLLLRRSLERDPNTGLLAIRRQEDFRDGDVADAGIGEFVPDQFFKLLADALRDTFAAVGIQAS